MGLLFTITGLGAIAIGIIAGIGFIRMTEDFPGIGWLSALSVIGGLGIGAFFLYLSCRIKRKR